MKRLSTGLLAVVLLAGCGARVKTTTSPPAGAMKKFSTGQQVQAWDSKMASLHKITGAVKTLRTTVTFIHNEEGFLSEEDYHRSLTALGHIDQYKLECARYMEEQPKGFGAAQQQKLRSEMGMISAELMTLTNINATGIKSSDNRTTVGQMIAEITSIVNEVLAPESPK